MKLILIITVLLSALSCNEPEPDQIAVKAVIPDVIIYENGIHHADTFKFKIESAEAVIDSVKLTENGILHVELGSEQFGFDKRELSLNFLYAPNSAGTKQFILKIFAPPFQKAYSFSVDVIQSN